MKKQIIDLNELIYIPIQGLYAKVMIKNELIFNMQNPTIQFVWFS